MNRKMTILGLAGCLMAGAVLWAEEAAPARPQMGQRDARRGMMMDGGDMGDPTLARALAPESLMVKELKLSPEQVASLKSIFHGQAKQAADLREKMREAAVKQAELMSQEMPDEAAVMKGIETIGEIRVATAKLWTGNILSALKVLTPEQRTQMHALLKERREKAREQMENVRQARQAQRKEKKPEGGPAMPPPPAEQPAPAEQPTPPAEEPPPAK